MSVGGHRRGPSCLRDQGVSRVFQDLGRGLRVQLGPGSIYLGVGRSGRLQHLRDRAPSPLPQPASIAAETCPTWRSESFIFAPRPVPDLLRPMCRLPVVPDKRRRHPPHASERRFVVTVGSQCRDRPSGPGGASRRGWGGMIERWRNQVTAMRNVLRGSTTPAIPVAARAESPECWRCSSLAKMPCTLPWRLFSWSPLFWCSTTTVTTF